jgi:hypothetical protein
MPNSLDAYETRFPLALAICKRLKKLYPNAYRFLEPSAGSGNFVNAIATVFQGATIHAIEIRAECLPMLRALASHSIICDFLIARSFPICDLVTGNPPFNEGEAHARKVLDNPEFPDGVILAYLLPVTFLAAKGRCEGLHKQHPLRYFQSIYPRPDFIYEGAEGGTAKAEYGLFIWEKGFKGHGEILEPLHWERD